MIKSVMVTGLHYHVKSTHFMDICCFILSIFWFMLHNDATYKETSVGRDTFASNVEKVTKDPALILHINLGQLGRALYLGEE